jgi:WD40 repeat protein
MWTVMGGAKRLVAVGLLTAAMAIGCQRQGPPTVAVRIAEITEANTHGAFLDSVAVSPDGSRVATGERSGAIKVWTPAAASDPLRLGNYRQAVADLAFSPDGGLLASIGRHRESTLRFWQDDRAGAWKEVAAIPIGRCLALRFDGAGARLAVMCEDELMLLDVASRQETLRLTKPHSEALTAFDFAANGSRLVTAGHEGTVTVWDMVTATPAPTHRFSVRRSRRAGPVPAGLEPDTAWAVAVAVSPDGTRAAAATIEGTMLVWDLQKGVDLLDEADNEATGPRRGSLRFGADERLLAPTGDRSGMRLIDPSRKGAKRSAVVASGGNAYHAVSVTDDAATFAVVTSTLGDRRLIYDVRVWRVLPPPIAQRRP